MKNKQRINTFDDESADMLMPYLHIAIDAECIICVLCQFKRVDTVLLCSAHF